MLTLRRAFLTRACALFVACLYLLISSSCSSWKYVRNDGAIDFESTLQDESVRFTQKKQTHEIIVRKVNYPFVSGPPLDNPDGEMIDIDLRLVTAFQVINENNEPGDAVALTNYDETLLRKRVRFHTTEKIYDLNVKEIVYPMAAGSMEMSSLPKVVRRWTCGKFRDLKSTRPTASPRSSR